MNLTKCFNYKFFKENFKKSKSILIFSLGIVPLLNFIFLLILALNSSKSVIIFSELSMITMLGSLVVPTVLAFSFFTFLFKQNSVDFYMSKPIKKSTMYLTNILGSLILLILFMLINSLVFGIINLTTSLVIPINIIIDYFCYWLSAYFLIFGIWVLAITLSGNALTSIIIVLLIFLMYPFLAIFHDFLINDSDMHYILYFNSQEINLNPRENFLFNSIISFVTNGVYNTGCMVKSFLLSLAYLALGYLGFTKRKMENNEGTFNNPKIYYLVKSLTFLPVCALGYVFVRGIDASYFLIVIVVALAYYIIYDIILRYNQTKLRYSILICIISFGLLEGSIALLDNVIYNKEIKYTNIDSILVDVRVDRTDDNIQYYKNVLINDPSFIKKILTKTADDISQPPRNFESSYDVKIGRKWFRADLVIDSDEEVIAYAKRNNMVSVLESIDYDDIKYIDTTYDLKIPITDNLKQLLIDNKSKNFVNNNDDVINLWVYQNHRYDLIHYQVARSKELEQLVANYENEDFIKHLNSVYITSIYSNQEYDNGNYDEALSYVARKNFKALTDFLKKHQKDKVKDEFITISSYENKTGKNHQYIIYDVDSFNELWQGFIDSLQNDSEYIRLTEEE